MLRFTVAAGLAGSLVSTALAQDESPSVNAHGFALAASDGDLLDAMSMWRPERQQPQSFGLQGLFEFSDGLLVLNERRPNGEENQRPLLDDLFALNLGAHYAPHERLAVAASLPIALVSRGANGTQGPTLGDLRLSVPVGLVLAPEEGVGLGLSVVPFLDLPTGNHGRFFGARTVSGGVTIPVGLEATEQFTVFGNIGFTVLQVTEGLNLTGGPQLLAGVGGAYAFHPTFALRAEATLNPVLQKNEVARTQAPSEAILSGRYLDRSGLSVTAGAAAGLSPGVGTATYRLFLGAGYRIGKGVRDADGDGIDDKLDACPEVRESVNGYKDEDGCPDTLANLTVLAVDEKGIPLEGVTLQDADGATLGTTDDSGRFEMSDQMPDTTVVVRGQREHLLPSHLRKAKLREGDNVVKLDMEWLPGRVRIVTRGPDGPVLHAVATFDGPSDREALPIEGGDEYAYLSGGNWTVFVSAEPYGTQRRDVEIAANETAVSVITFDLQEAKVKVGGETVELSEKVFFDTGKSSIQPASFPLLDEVASVLSTHPEILKIELQGHTDSQGGAKYNRELSQGRVDSVRAYLIGKGVDASRMTAVGYGEDKPIASNANDEGRSENRRVEISILELAETP